MNRSLSILTVSFSLVLSIAAGAWASPFGESITISDKVYQSATGWYGSQEDNEVEPGCIQGQYWDLEGFYLDGKMLTMVGGYNFVTGRDGYDSGDLFIDINGDAKYGPGTGGGSSNSTVRNTFGYDYVIDINFTSRAYNILKLDSASTVTVFYSQNDESNPWRYASGGTLLETGTFQYVTGLSDSYTELSGGYHNAATFDLGFLRNRPEFSGDFMAHFTMECGNDNLMGRGTIAPVPEPATLFLLGSGVIGLAGFRRKTK